MSKRKYLRLELRYESIKTRLEEPLVNLYSFDTKANRRKLGTLVNRKRGLNQFGWGRTAAVVLAQRRRGVSWGWLAKRTYSFIRD